MSGELRLFGRGGGRGLERRGEWSEYIDDLREGVVRLVITRIHKKEFPMFFSAKMTRKNILK